MSTLPIALTGSHESAERPTAPPAPQRRNVIAALLVVLATMAGTVWPSLNNDVTYAFGGIANAGKGGVSVWDVFVARPIAYRLLIHGLDSGRSLLVGDPSLTITQLVIRAETGLLVAAVATVLFLGLRHFLEPQVAAIAAVTTGLALIAAPPWHFLQPDWVAALAAVLAVGAACAPRPVWAGALLGGLAVTLVIAVKLATLPIAILAVLLVGVLNRRRAAWTAVATAGFTVLWYAATKHFLPWEWTWLNDQANLVDDSPIHHGLRWADFHHLLIGTGDVAVLSPIMLAAPPAAVALIRRLPTGRSRVVGAAVAVVAAGLSLAAAYGQGEFYMYHYASVPVLAAGTVGAAFALCPAARLPLAATAALGAVAAFLLLHRPAAWRLTHATAVDSAFAVAAIAVAVVVWVTANRRPWSPPIVLGTAALGATLAVASLPGSPYAFSTYDYQYHINHQSTAAFTALRARIGANTPVLYLTFGSVNNLMGNPTSCRYPSPQWLQRGAGILRVRAYPSYADNLRCLTDDHQARYLILQPGWFNVNRSSPQVRNLIAAQFDCSPAARIPAPKTLEVCPARQLSTSH
ncbi:hypothetical protein ODJ79_35010 [Actinoplanes sp. KI2]|uniref:hypothetical protein n=1 Tax=Actinoplanes sp. KI2 TaxID=2983315 RepID=UPI0021D59048|nr:hypothetical protein [Actinoplanes sp. KI2]MCU7728951.1 hypothetical protein [Actinoplanes sp. KI2]